MRWSAPSRALSTACKSASATLSNLAFRGSGTENDLRERAGIINIEPGLVRAEGDPLGQGDSVQVELKSKHRITA
jgi:hypothetical protein